jgi:3-hydroxybutyryl-CoA dehydratase
MNQLHQEQTHKINRDAAGSLFGSRAAPMVEDEIRGDAASRWGPARNGGNGPNRGGGHGGGSDGELDRFRQGPLELPPFKITQSDVNIFAKISGDHNPYHLDAQYARNSIYQERIAHSLLTAAFALVAIQEEIPSYSIEEIEISRFTAPVFIGDSIFPTILGVQREGQAWRLEFAAANEDTIEILHGNAWIRLRMNSENTPAISEAFGVNLSTTADLRKISDNWASSVTSLQNPNPSALTIGQQSEHVSYVNRDRLTANLALFESTSLLDQLFIIESIAQVSAEFAPGFILVGAEIRNFAMDASEAKHLRAKAIVTRRGTLVHRNIDRIRLDIEINDHQDNLVALGALYKESEDSIVDAITTEPLYQGAELIVPPNEKRIKAGITTRIQPFRVIIDLTQIENDLNLPHKQSEVCELIRTLLGSRPLPQGLFLQINPLQSPRSTFDMLYTVSPLANIIDGVILSSVQGPHEVSILDRALHAIEISQQVLPGKIKIHPAIDAPKTALSGEALVHASSRVTGLVYALPSKSDTQEVRTFLVRATWEAGVDAIDGTIRPNDDSKTAALDTVRASFAGFQRKWIRTPSQLNGLLDPKLYLSNQDMARAGAPTNWAEKVLAHTVETPTLWAHSYLRNFKYVTIEPHISFAEIEALATDWAPMADLK